jgi:AsmA family
MIRLRKYGGIAIVIVSILLAVQAGASLLMRTNRGRGYLIAHLESAFGRPVQASRFSVQILPIPELEVEGITIGEDRAFGSEYFLRAEQMTAGFRWMGLLRGHIEFGTMVASRKALRCFRSVAKLIRFPFRILEPSSENRFRRRPYQLQTRRREEALCFHRRLGKRGAGFSGALAVETGSTSLAQRGGFAVHWNIASDGRCGRNVRASAAGAAENPLGKSVACRFIPNDYRK